MNTKISFECFLRQEYPPICNIETRDEKQEDNHTSQLTAL